MLSPLRLEEDGLLGCLPVVDILVTEDALPVCRARATFGHVITHLVTPRWETLLAPNDSPLKTLPDDFLRLVFEQDRANPVCVGLPLEEHALRRCTGLTLWQRFLRMMGCFHPWSCMH